MRRCGWSTLWVLLGVIGCATMDAGPIGPGAMVLPAGGRVLLFEVSRAVFSYRIDRFAEPPRLQGVETVQPQAAGLKGPVLEDLVKQAIRDTPADLALGLRSTRQVGKKYHPYRAFRGWRTASVVDGYVAGRPVFREVSTPVYETRFKNTCTVVTYRVYQFNGSGALTGVAKIADPAAPQCPDTTDSDIVIDDIDDVADWLSTRLSGGDR